MEDEYIYNVKAKVRLVKPQGYGFLSFADQDQPHEDVYFHISQVTNEGMKWEEVKTGMKMSSRYSTLSVANEVLGTNYKRKAKALEHLEAVLVMAGELRNPPLKTGNN